MVEHELAVSVGALCYRFIRGLQRLSYLLESWGHQRRSGEDESKADRDV